MHALLTEGTTDVHLDLRGSGSGLSPLPDLPEPWQIPRLIGLSGYAQSGKDTVGRIITEHYGHEPVSFSDKLREFLYAQRVIYLPDGRLLNDVVDEIGWEEARLVYPVIRELQQYTGTDAGRNLIYDRIWVDASMRSMLPGQPYVFTSVRFPNEAEVITEAGGVLLRVVRPGVGPVNAHMSDTQLDGWRFDGIVVNSGTILDLHTEVTKTLEGLKS